MSEAYRTLPIPKDLYIPITYGIYETILDHIRKNDPKAKEMVEWYKEHIGFSAKWLEEELKAKEA